MCTIPLITFLFTTFAFVFFLGFNIKINKKTTIKQQSKYK